MIASLQAELASTTLSRDELSESLARGEQTVASLQDELASVQSEHHEVSQLLVQLTADKKLLEEQINSLKMEVTHARESWDAQLNGCRTDAAREKERADVSYGWMYYFAAVCYVLFNFYLFR